MSPRVSLLMPNRDNAPVLDLVLERLAVNSRYDDLELVVVDDGSTDGSREILRRWRDSGRFPEFKLIEREPSGVIETLNAGLAQATGELIVQLDGDASVETPGWVQKMVDLMDVDPRVGVVTGKIVFDWGELHTCGVDVVGPDGFHDRGAEILEPQGRRTYHQRVLRRREGDCPACDEPAEVDGGIGCCMMYRREAALELGGYDPGWAPVWFDDLDLTMGMRRLGLKCFYLPGVHVTHHVGHRVGRRRLSAALPAAHAQADQPAAEHGPPAEGAVGPHPAPLRLLAGEVGLGHAQPRHGRRPGALGPHRGVLALRRGPPRRGPGDPGQVRVGVPIVSTNEAELLRHTLPLVMEQADVDVVVFDNASTDDTAEVARAGGRALCALGRAPLVRAGHEHRARASDTEAVLFVQPDCFLAPGFVAAAAAHLDDPAWARWPRS